MKSFLKYFLIAIVITTLIPISACRKGPNDPWISFISRTARFAGAWKLTSSDKVFTKNKLNGTTLTTTTDHYVFDGTTVTLTETIKIGNGVAVTNTSTYPYNELWTVEKANTYTFVYTSGTNTTTVKGSWSWMNSNSDVPLKNKEAVVLLPASVSGSSSGSNGKLDDPKILVLDELKNTEMIIKQNSSTDDGQGSSNGVKTTTVATFTYNQ